MSSTARSTSINLRITPERLAIIDQAAEIRGQSRTEFILQNAQTAAEGAILDRTVFHLSAESFAAFTAALDAPAEPNDRLTALRKKKPIWA